MTDHGFLDVIEIGRSHRPSLYDSSADRPIPLVERDRRFNSDAADLVSLLEAADPETVVVALKDAYLDPSAEVAVGERIRAAIAGLDVVLSHQIANEFREFERTSTAVVAGYLRASVDRYLEDLQAAAIPDIAS